ncbi:unnamed protein product [Protopolystoma xenopodis]|uniref:Uncharacterized protein n=1 Tax=Protopolystoma xenopodis TaxID=117903 RepID=A0A448WL07_9PLAT|nr:unnamed protein product [Protopolystoma xenopodis]
MGKQEDSQSSECIIIVPRLDPSPITLEDAVSISPTVEFIGATSTETPLVVTGGPISIVPSTPMHLGVIGRSANTATVEVISHPSTEEMITVLKQTDLGHSILPQEAHDSHMLTKLTSTLPGTLTTEYTLASLRNMAKFSDKKQAILAKESMENLIDSSPCVVEEVALPSILPGQQSLRPEISRTIRTFQFDQSVIHRDQMLTKEMARLRSEKQAYYERFKDFFLPIVAEGHKLSLSAEDSLALSSRVSQSLGARQNQTEASSDHSATIETQLHRWSSDFTRISSTSSRSSGYTEIEQTCTVHQLDSLVCIMVALEIVSPHSNYELELIERRLEMIERQLDSTRACASYARRLRRLMTNREKELAILCGRKVSDATDVGPFASKGSFFANDDDAVLLTAFVSLILSLVALHATGSPGLTDVLVRLRKIILELAAGYWEYEWPAVSVDRDKLLGTKMLQIRPPLISLRRKEAGLHFIQLRRQPESRGLGAFPDLVTSSGHFSRKTGLLERQTETMEKGTTNTVPDAEALTSLPVVQRKFMQSGQIETLVKENLPKVEGLIPQNAGVGKESNRDRSMPSTKSSLISWDSGHTTCKLHGEQIQLNTCLRERRYESTEATGWIESDEKHGGESKDAKLEATQQKDGKHAMSTSRGQVSISHLLREL